MAQRPLQAHDWVRGHVGVAELQDFYFDKVVHRAAAVGATEAGSSRANSIGDLEWEHDYDVGQSTAAAAAARPRAESNAAVRRCAHRQPGRGMGIQQRLPRASRSCWAPPAYSRTWCAWKKWNSFAMLRAWACPSPVVWIAPLWYGPFHLPAQPLSGSRPRPKRDVRVPLAQETDHSIFITDIVPGGAADRTGRLYAGDAIVSINGVSLEGRAHHDAVKLLKTDDALHVSRGKGQCSDPASRQAASHAHTTFGVCVCVCVLCVLS